MSAVDAYLFFDGTCAEAMRFYERVLRGKLEILMTNAEAPAPAQVPPGNEKRIMHARLVLDGRNFMASDAIVGRPYEGMKGFSLSVSYPTVAEAKKIFDQLADGGEVRMPFQETFWAKGFGMLVDRFGTPWMVNGQMSM
jgi:PhnB protein